VRARGIRHEQRFTIQTVGQKAPADGGTHNAQVAYPAGIAEVAAQQACGARDELRGEGYEDDGPQRSGSHQLEWSGAARHSPLSPFDHQ